MPITLYEGDCLQVLQSISDESIDSVVTDPPYGLSFMGKKWDYDVPSVEIWKEILRVLKPGGHVLSFSGTRTYHRMVVNIEDAGFEIRDQLGWLYGTGFPKSHNLKGEWEGWGTSLKPAWEPICMARKPIATTVADNMAAHHVGAINIDACRVPTDNIAKIGTPSWGGPMKRLSAVPGQEGKLVPRTPPSNKGRWPTNVVHDGSDEVVTHFPNTSSGKGTVMKKSSSNQNGNTSAAYGRESRPEGTPLIWYGDSGSAARIFYCSKATKAERMGSKHPTIKPISLMQYLCKLVTPPNGLILDPFAGSGTTGQAAVEEGFNAILIEREKEYCDDIRSRLALFIEY